MTPATSSEETQAAVVALIDSLPTAVALFEDQRLAHANPAARALLGVVNSSAAKGDATAEASALTDVLGNRWLAGAVSETTETGAPLELELGHGDRRLLARTSTTTTGAVALVLTDLTELRRIEALRRDFVTNASHELKTPVAGIQALSDSLELAMERNPERARSMVQRLQIEAERLAQLVRDLLDLARLEDHEPGTGGQWQRVDVAELVRTQVERLQAFADELGVTLTATCADEAAVVGSLADLRLIVTNLLENAIQYNRPGGTVSVNVRRDGDRVLLEVADSGLGIPVADQDRIFERFYRVDKARSRLAGGTGLGLSLVRHAVQLHEGSVAVESEPGVGSTFRVQLPVTSDR